MPMSTVRAARGTLCLPAPAPAACLPAVPFAAPWGATAAAAAAVRHTKKNSKPKRRQQNNFILFSGGKQRAVSREGARGEGQREGSRGSHQRNVELQLWSQPDFASLQVCTQCSKIQGVQTKAPKSAVATLPQSCLRLLLLVFCL